MVVQPEVNVAVPSDVLPSLKVIVPVGVAPEGVLTVAVNVTLPPKPMEAFEDTSVVVLLPLPTVTATADEVLAPKLLSPEYTAVNK